MTGAGVLAAVDCNQGCRREASRDGFTASPAPVIQDRPQNSKRYPALYQRAKSGLSIDDSHCALGVIDRLTAQAKARWVNPAQGSANNAHSMSATTGPPASDPSCRVGVSNQSRLLSLAIRNSAMFPALSISNPAELMAHRMAGAARIRQVPRPTAMGRDNRARDEQSQPDAGSAAGRKLLGHFLGARWRHDPAPVDHADLDVRFPQSLSPTDFPTIVAAASPNSRSLASSTELRTASPTSPSTGPSAGPSITWTTYVLGAWRRPPAVWPVRTRGV